MPVIKYNGKIRGRPCCDASPVSFFECIHGDSTLDNRCRKGSDCLSHLTVVALLFYRINTMSNVKADVLNVTNATSWLHCRKSISIW